MHWKEYRINTRISSGDTFVFNKQLLVSVPGHGCDDCCFYEKKECGIAPPCADTLFQPVPADTDLYLTLRLRGEI